MPLKTVNAQMLNMITERISERRNRRLIVVISLVNKISLNHFSIKLRMKTQLDNIKKNRKSKFVNETE